MYRLKWALLVILLALPVLRRDNLQAANAGLVDNVRNKSVLNDNDKKVIDKFVEDCVASLISEKDFTNVARHRDAIISRKDSKQPQYVDKFNESAVTHITKAFETAKSIKPEQKQAFVIANLLILIDKLESVKFAILAKNNLDVNNMVVRYWAVKCLTNPEVIRQLNSGESPNPGLPREITAKLISIVPKSSPATLSMMARYAASINIPQGQELLLKVADQRIANYANWSVKQEYEDGEILQILADEITKPSGNTNVPAVAQRFAQLYSYVIQKYVKAFRSLHASQKTQLVTVIIETENKCIRNMIGSHPNIRKAIEDEQLQTLMDEHNKLLGSDTARGELPTKYNFYYGTDGNAPLTLSDPK